MRLMPGGLAAMTVLALSACHGFGDLPAGPGATVTVHVQVPWTVQARASVPADVHHYTLKLNRVSDATVIRTATSTNLTTQFAAVPDGTYDLTAEAFSSTDDTVSITQGGPQRSTNQVTVRAPAVTYSTGSALAVTVNLLDGTGTTTTNTVNLSYLGDTVTPDHYTYKLYDATNTLLLTGSSSNTSTHFTGVPDGTLHATVEAFSSANDSTSVTLGANPPTLAGVRTSNTLTFPGASTTFSANLTLFINTWAQKAVMGSTNWQGTATTVNGKLYAIGGLGTPTGTAMYDPGTNTWTAKAAAAAGMRNHAAAAVGTTIYAIGQYGAPATGPVRAYDTVANTWANKTAMPTARFGLGAVALNGKIYAIGGHNGNAGGYLTTNEVYDPATDSWSSLAPMTTARYNFGLVVIDGKIYAVGGLGTAATYPTEVYDPTTDTWTTKATMPTKRNGFATAVVNKRIYTISGQNASVLTTVEMYDPAVDAWYTMAPIPTGVWYCTGDAINNRIYVLGGYNGSSAVNLNQVYSP